MQYTTLLIELLRRQPAKKATDLLLIYYLFQFKELYYVTYKHQHRFMIKIITHGVFFKLLSKTAAVTLIAVGSLFFLPVIAQQSPAMVFGPSWASEVPQRQGNFGFSGSPAYRLEVSHLLLKEANQAAMELGLPDNLPISKNNVTRLIIYPPRLARNVQGIGSVVTSNYIYSVSCGYKFSGLTRAHLQQEDKVLESKYVLPMAQIDTNAAFQLATQFLAKASIDVTALNRDCRVHISLEICPDYEHFVPIYHISWDNRKEQRFGSIASVEVFLPDKALRQLHVTKSEYILSQPLRITDPEFVNWSATNPRGQFRNFGLPPPQQ